MKIKVYAADAGQLEDTNLFDHFYRLVSAERREKVDRMRFYPDKCLSLGAGALLEAALAAEGLSDLTMTTEGYQKPCLAHRPDIHFNISHSGTKVIVLYLYVLLLVQIVIGKVAYRQLRKKY